MSLTSINRSFERGGRGQLFLKAYPAANPGATSSLTDVVKGFFGLFYADGDARKTLSGGVNPYCNLDASGLSVKFKQETIDVDPNNGPKHAIAIKETSCEAEINFYDVDPAHLADAFNLKAEELLTIAASVGKAGKVTALIGGQSVLNRLVALYRMPSPDFPGEYDHYLFPRVVIAPDTDIKLSKKDAIALKLKLSCQPDLYLINSDGFSEIAMADISNAAAL